MNICVCIKQVPDTNEIKVDPVTHTLVRKGVPSIVNPFDTYAQEVGVRLKEKLGGKVVVISMGPEQAKEAIKTCLSVGADAGYLISSRKFGGSDTLATSYILSEAIKAVYMAIPVEVLDGASIVVGMDTYRTYVMELTEKNLFHYNPVVDAANELVMPGTTTKVIGVPGLNGTKRIFAMDLARNVFYGTDMENDQEKFIFKQDEKQGNHYLIINFNAGVQVAFPDQVVSYEMV